MFRCTSIHTLHNVVVAANYVGYFFGRNFHIPFTRNDPTGRTNIYSGFRLRGMALLRIHTFFSNGYSVFFWKTLLVNIILCRGWCWRFDVRNNFFTRHQQRHLHVSGTTIAVWSEFFKYCNLDVCLYFMGIFSFRGWKEEKQFGFLLKKKKKYTCIFYWKWDRI